MPFFFLPCTYNGRNVVVIQLVHDNAFQLEPGQHERCFPICRWVTVYDRQPNTNTPLLLDDHADNIDVSRAKTELLNEIRVCGAIIAVRKRRYLQCVAVLHVFGEKLETDKRQ